MNIPALVDSQKKYFGTYSVMAMLNAQMVLDHIQKVLDIEDNDNKKDENLWDHPVMKYLEDAAKGCDTRPEKTLLLQEKLLAYFPFLKVMAENQKDYFNKKKHTNRLEVNASDIHGAFDSVLRVLKTFRDASTHLVFKDDRLNDDNWFAQKLEPRVATIINKYYDVALRNTKERYGYTTADLAFLQDHRYKKTIVEGKRCTLPNNNFFLSMVSYSQQARRSHLSGVGVAQLICLFLDKQYINLFLSRLPIFSAYDRRSAERRVIMRSMAINSIRLPKDRIHTVKCSRSVAMDMLNEVKRCPAELFDTLTPASQARFRIVSDDHNEVLMKRRADRFAPLFLQYIDYGRLFDKIRFHVNMGKLRYLFKADKHCIDGQTRVRVLEQPINAFGRIDEMEAQRWQDNGTFAQSGIRIRDFENVRRDDADPAHYPYVVDTYTHYMLENNKVEMSFEDYMPPIKDGRYVWRAMPACRMSTLELPAMAFHMMLLGSKATERRIREVYDNYQRLFKAMAAHQVDADNIGSFGIAEADMPKIVRDLVHGRAHGKDVNAFTQSAVDELLADTLRRQERLKDDRRAIRSGANKMGKRSFKQISTGRLAAFLAEDIVRMQPSLDNGQNKLTGLNYRVMQSAMAVYDSHEEQEQKTQFKQLFERAHLLDEDPHVCHPFLRRVFARTIPANVVEFYDRYLAERRFYLVGLQREMAKGHMVQVPFVKRNQSKWMKPEMGMMGEVYGEDLPVELPRQMFDDDIKRHLKNLPEMKNIDFDKANVTYLIAEYMRRVLHDDFQAFYQWKRHYRYMDMLIGETDDKGMLVGHFMTVEERERLWADRQQRAQTYQAQAAKKLASGRMTRGTTADDIAIMLDQRLSNCRNEYQKNEKVIRRHKVQDALLFLLAKQMLTRLADIDGERFKLKEVMPDADKGLLSEVMPMSFTFEKGGHTYTITSEGMKLKNYGDFFVLANDKRLGRLMDIVGSDTVSKENLLEEFRKYDQCRPEVVSIVFDIERWAMAAFPDLATCDRVNFKVILERLKTDNRVGEEQGWILSQIRNAFDHNNYPSKGVVEIHTLPQVAVSMKQLFGEYAVIQ